MARRPLFLAALLVVPARSAFCCFWPETADRCDACESQADTTNFCGGGASACETDCGHVWCDVTDAPSATAAPTFAGGDWHQGTYTTGYWDCCKPSCSWSGKGDVDAPVLSCEAETGAALSSPDVTSVCDGGTAASCASNQPWTYNDGVSLGFAAAAVGGITGLDGDTNCGQCYELVWTDDTHSWGGGAHASLVGRSHVIQVTNIGYDVTGDHSFDLQIPGAGQGIFDTGCAIQFPGYDSGDFDCDNNYGGCADNSGCDRLPDDLRSGCDWRYDDYLYNEGGTSNNPYVRFRRVRCPAELVAITGSTPNDDDDYPALNLDAYASDYTQPPTTAAPTTLTPRPTAAPTTAAPSTAAPSAAPVAESPAPVAPSPAPSPSPTPAPTTAEPTAAPTTAEPTTAAPTPAPTTAEPTTATPTPAPTTPAPSTAVPSAAPTASPAPTAAPASSGGSKKKQNPATRRVRAGGVVLFAAAAAVTFVVGFAVAACVFRRRTSKWQTTELDHTHSWGFSPPNEAKAVGPGGDWQRTSSFNGRSSFTGPTNFDL